MIRTTQTAPCATCRQPVTVTASTVRSRYGDRPLCDSCSITPWAAADRFDIRAPYLVGESRTTAPRAEARAEPARSAGVDWDRLRGGEVRMVDPDPDGEVRHIQVGDYVIGFPANAYTEDELAEIEARSDEIAERVVEAVAVRFNVPYPAVAEDGSPCFVTYSPSAFDEQLAERDDSQPPLIFRDHGGRGPNGERRAGLRSPVGQVFGMVASRDALTVTGLMDATEAGWHVHADMVDGSLPAFSSHVVPVRMVEVGEFRGAPHFRIDEGWLMETGPTDVPADPDCRILAVGGEVPMPPDFTVAGRALVRDMLAAAGVR